MCNLENGPRSSLRRALLISAAVLLPFCSELAAQSRGRIEKVADMTAARFGHTATLLRDGRVLVTGGYGEPNFDPRSAEIYDPALRTFTPTGSMLEGRGRHAGTLLPDGRVLITGGNYDFPPNVTAEIYDPKTGRFTRTGSMRGREGHSAILLRTGKVLITGGARNSVDDIFADPELYEPSTGNFTPTGTYARGPGSHGLLGAGASLLPDGKVLITGNNYAEIFDPLSGTFNFTGDEMASAEYRDGMVEHTATTLQNGTVLVAGGRGYYQSGCTSLKAAEIYDRGLFRKLRNSTFQRSQHTATLLQDGTVLIAGGQRDACASVDTLELYEAAAETFLEAGTMQDTRRLHTATLLGDGSVLIAGGLSGGGPLKSAELYLPASMSPAPGEGSCEPTPWSACLLGSFAVQVRYRSAFDNNPVDTYAFAKEAEGFADASYETSFFHFNSPNNVEVMVKVLDQGNVIDGVRTIAVITGVATPLRVEVTVTDTRPGGVARVYRSDYGTQKGVSDFAAFVK